MAAAVENNGAADALVRIVSNASVPTAQKNGWWFTRRRVPRVPSQQGADPGADTAVVSRREARVACAGDAANALRKMAAEPAIATRDAKPGFRSRGVVARRIARRRVGPERARYHGRSARLAHRRGG